MTIEFFGIVVICLFEEISQRSIVCEHYSILVESHILTV